jgi:hypothetical protein
VVADIALIFFAAHGTWIANVKGVESHMRQSDEHYVKELQ